MVNANLVPDQGFLEVEPSRNKDPNNHFVLTQCRAAHFTEERSPA
jgi:hypothetical protein